MGYLQAVETFIHRASQWGIFVLLDMHLLRADTAPDPLPFDERTSLGNVVDAWDVLAERMCHKWSVIGADLKNEPYGATWNEWQKVAETLAETVSKRCPSWMIFVEGILKYDSPRNPLTNDMGAPWGAMLLPVRESPIRILNKNKLVYSPHVYGPGTIGNNFMWDENKGVNWTCRQENYTENCEDFLGKSFPENLPAVYDLWFGFLKSELNMTVIVGEWGGDVHQPTSIACTGEL